MAIRVQNFPKKAFDQSSIYSMSNFAVNCPSWWNSQEQQFPQSISKHLSLKLESPPQLCEEARHLRLQRHDQDSSSTQSTVQSHHEVTAMGGTNAQDQSISSESVPDESYEKHSEFVNISPSQIDSSQSINHIPHPYADPYGGGLFASYGPPTVIQPQMVGMTPARVALPLDLAEDGPIYVNSKQYHAILRRRQMRAKLEAQNKLVKTRRPYLHESRHVHALNRVRGSGGRFLSTKKLQQPDLTPTPDSRCISNSIHSYKKDASEFEICQSETVERGASIPSFSNVTGVSNSDVFQQPYHRFSAISPHTDVGNGTRHCASVIR
ncbi:hypothetical protein CsSME_00024718 [Camellia sinensis var. sinensis]